MRLFDANPDSLPGPGDIDPGPSACLMPGACPHDHDVIFDCDICGAEVVTSQPRSEFCDRCTRLVGEDHEELVRLYRDLEAELDAAQRRANDLASRLVRQRGAA